MNAIGQGSRSLWMDVPMPDRPAVSGDLTCEVVVIGAGIAGLSVAYELAKHRSVVVLDRGAIARGMSSRTSAHLSSTHDDLFQEYARLRGKDEARLFYESQSAAVDRIEEISTIEQIACDFRRLDGYLFRAAGAEESVLERELEICREIGFEDVAFVDKAPLGGTDTGRCLRFPRQARFHPRKYLAGLVPALERDGVKLFAHSPVVSVSESDSDVTAQLASGHSVHAKSAVVCTNAPILDRLKLHVKQAPYRTYVIALRAPKSSITDGLFWDTADPYHYVRLQPADGGHDWLIVGGEDHKTGEADDFDARIERLEAWARAYFPEAGRMEFNWSGQVMLPFDYAAFSGLHPGSRAIYLHTGDSGQGLTSGAMAGMLLRDLILERPNHWAKVYDPKRRSPGAAAEFVKENSTAVVGLVRHLTPGEVKSSAEIPNGQGALIRKGLRKLAVYRDEGGTVHALDATCPHAGCIVQWNAFETCWDCPCHGSQFSVDGEPLNAPAIGSLKPVQV